jgi:hypothetical protein
MTRSEPAFRRYFWDFFGPNGAGTARHFLVHLDEFLSRHSLSGCETGVVSAGPAHHAVFCIAPAAVQASIESALRPRRSEAVEANPP